MIPKDSDRFKALLTGVFSLYGRDLSEIVLSIWWGAMRPYDFEAVKDALNRHAVNPDNGQFLPKPADVVKLIDGGAADVALLAWAKFEEGFMRFGPYNSIVFDDPIIHRVIRDMGGMPSLCEHPQEEWPFIRNHFVALYRGYRMRGALPDYPPRLVGIAEQHNASHGFAVAPPILIGDQERARLVHQRGSTKLLEARPLAEALPAITSERAP
jgi:hypothetical protein